MAGNLWRKGLTAEAVVWNGPHLSVSPGGRLSPAHHTHKWTVRHSHQVLITQNTSTDMHVHTGTPSQVDTAEQKHHQINGSLGTIYLWGSDRKTFLGKHKVTRWKCDLWLNPWSYEIWRLTEATIRKEACSSWLNMRLSLSMLAYVSSVCACACVCASSHLWQGWERRSLLAQEKLDAEVSWLAHFHTQA